MKRVAAFLILSFFAAAPAGAGSVPRAGLGPPRSPLLERFDAEYDALTRRAAEGGEPQRQALEVRRSLRHYLADTDAGIELLVGQVLREEGHSRVRALGALLEEVAKRERVIMEHLRRLEALDGAAAGSRALRARPPWPPSRDISATPASPRIQIQFGAEDLSNTQME